MVAIQPLVSEFTITGKLLDLVVDSKGRVKYLYLSTPEAEYSIEVAKQKLQMDLQAGCHLRVSGMRKNKLHQGEVKYKAYRIELLSESPAIDKIARPDRTRTKILVCQGSSCLQRGSNICKLLRNELQIAGLDGVQIQTTGCIKQCKQAPNLVMPGRERYSRVKSAQISGLIKKHF